MKKIFIAALIVYLLCNIVLYLAQRKLMYFPTVEEVDTELTTVSINVAGEKVVAIVSNAKRQQSSDTAILYFPGNAENVWWVTEYMRQFFESHTVYYLNYPGYGGSEGTPTEQSLLAAAGALYQHAVQYHKNIILVGRSLGTGVAVDVASKHQVAAMILISPYDSIAKVAAGHYPVFPVRWLIKDQYDSLAKSQSIKRLNPDIDVLVFQGSADRVVPARHSDILTAAMQSEGISVTATEFDGYGHNNITEHPDFLSMMQEFFLQ